MDERPWEALRMMYDLFCQADLVCHINNALSSYICQTGEKILKEEGSSLTEFKAHVDKICFTYFSEDPLLEKTAQKCFEGLGMSVVPTEEMLELGSSGPFPTSHWLPRLNLGHVAFGCFFTLIIRACPLKVLRRSSHTSPKKKIIQYCKLNRLVSSGFIRKRRFITVFVGPTTRGDPRLVTLLIFFF